MKNRETITALSMITQFGLSMIVTLLLCVFGAKYLKDKFFLGNWIMIVGIIVGILCSVITMINFVKSMLKIFSSSDK